MSKCNERFRLASDEEIGVGVDIDDPAAIAAIAAACADLLCHADEERQQLRAHCRSVALERYTWDLSATGPVAPYRRLERDGPAA